jgi:hypothetical protein
MTTVAPRRHHDISTATLAAGPGPVRGPDSGGGLGSGGGSNPGGRRGAAGGPPPAGDPSSGQHRPAAIAAARVSRASLGLGGLGLAAALFVVARLLETWRVTPAAGGHRIVILGQRLSYPVANLDAIVVVVLAALGAVVTVRAVAGAVREARASTRFHRILSAAALEALPRAPGVLLVADEQPRAFCAG